MLTSLCVPIPTKLNLDFQPDGRARGRSVGAGSNYEENQSSSPLC